jgi:hypothetical protein
MTGLSPHTDHCQTYMTSEQKTALNYWKTLIERVLVSGRPCVTELNFWLKPMGFKLVSGKLSLPSSMFATQSNLWKNIELYWLDWHWYYEGFKHPESDPYRPDPTVYLRLDPVPDQSGLRTLLATYPRWDTSFFELLNYLYNRVRAALIADRSYLQSISGFTVDNVIAGMLILFEYFLSFSVARSNSFGYLKLYIPSYDLDTLFGWASGSIGPYTTSVYYCENGVIRGISLDIQLKKVAHQSIDAYMHLDGSVQKNVTALMTLSAPHKFEVEADVVKMETVENPIETTMCLFGPLRIPLKAHEAIRDRVDNEILADERLAITDLMEVEASMRLVGTYMPLEADICVQEQRNTYLTAKMLLLPDTLDEVKVDLEKYYIQRFRIRAQPIPYNVYDSRKNEEEGVEP